MPSVTFDGRSFLIDGRRIWLVSGRIPYALIPRESWPQRILAAKHAGLNTIEAPVVWSRHEPRPGKFDFTGDQDLRHFIDLVGKAGMHCILGLGPFVGSELDMGGLPPWLRDLNGVKLRTASGPFLETCSRFFTAVADQIKGWQATAPGAGGPIVLIQVEQGWTCGHDALAAGYLGELTRYVREAGLNVPLINSNNMWSSVEGQIDGWSGTGPMLSTMRQLAGVRPGQPRVVVDVSFASPTHWGHEPEKPVSGGVMLRRLAEILAGGGQFNITSWCGGTHTGFGGGRSGLGLDRYTTASAAEGCLFDETGRASKSLGEVRRLTLAASKFARVFANLDPAHTPVSLSPAERPTPGACAVVHASGSQGGVAFIFGHEPGAAKPERIDLTLLMRDGSTLPVPTSSNALAWCFFDVNISGRAKLDFANVSALGSVGQTLVLFGPAGATAIASVNGSPVETTIPDDDEPPAIIPHEGLTLVIVSPAAAERVFFTDDAVLVGVADVGPGGSVVLPAGQRSYTKLGADGVAKVVHAEPPARTRGERITQSAWQTASVADYLDGTSERFASIETPRDLGALGCAYGYGWYRLTPATSASRKARAVLPHAADRLHFFAEGHAVGVVGAGPGAEPEITLPLKKGGSALVALADNMGRFSSGATLGEAKGLFGAIYEVSPLRAPKPRLESDKPVDILTFRAPLWDLSEGDATSPDRITWTLPGKRKTPVVMSMPTPPHGALLLVNGVTVAFIDRSGPAQVVLTPEQLGKSSNIVQLALVAHGRADAELEAQGDVSFEQVEGDLLEGAALAFAKWEAPPASAYGAKAHHAAGTPQWHRCTFTADPADGPLMLEPAGMTKGQVMVNGRHLCRYWVATASGRRVPPQDRYVIPASWFKAGQANELVLFDEHGGHPARCKLSR